MVCRDCSRYSHGFSQGMGTGSQSCTPAKLYPSHRSGGFDGSLNSTWKDVSAGVLPPVTFPYTKEWVISSRSFFDFLRWREDEDRGNGSIPILSTRYMFSLWYEPPLMTFLTNRNTHHPRKRAHMLVFEGGCLPSHHHHLPLPSKMSIQARFRGRLLFTPPPPLLTLEDEYVFKGVATVYHPPHLSFPLKMCTYARFRRRLFTPSPPLFILEDEHTLYHHLPWPSKTSMFLRAWPLFTIPHTSHSSRKRSLVC